MKNPLIEPTTYVDEMVVLVSKEEKIKLNKLISEFIKSENNKQVKTVKSVKK